MILKCNIDVNEIPIRFLPEASAPLKSWLTRNNRELLTLKDIENDFKAGGNSHMYWWVSEKAARGLIEILVIYRRTFTKFMEIEIPSKYDKTINVNNFVV